MSTHTDKVILVVEIRNYRNIPTGYEIKKTADSLEKASEYLVSLRNLNDSENTTYELFNAFGQLDDTIIESEEARV